jgi:hypothetical protein
MNYINRRRNSGRVGKTIKDYIVPIIAILLVAVLIYSLF